MVAICQKCGVRGYVDLLIYCKLCRVSAEHIYCLDTMSNINEEVIEWSCEQCIPTNFPGKHNLQPTFKSKERKFKQPQENPSVCDASKKILSNPSMEYNKNAYGLPIIDPVWRGCFEISNEKYGTLAAHISNKACLKVWEGAKAMPQVLHLEMLSRNDVWPKRFDLSAPTSDEIALYFFQETEREAKLFDELIQEVIDMDLALKALFNNSELLIFPSDQLPQLYWRFHGSYYLWGVFRGKAVPVIAS